MYSEQRVTCIRPHVCPSGAMARLTPPPGAGALPKSSLDSGSLAALRPCSPGPPSPCSWPPPRRSQNSPLPRRRPWAQLHLIWKTEMLGCSVSGDGSAGRSRRSAPKTAQDGRLARLRRRWEPLRLNPGARSTVCQALAFSQPSSFFED